MRLIVLFIFIGHLTFAQQKVTEISNTDHGNALLWKISGPRLKKNSYLFGTAHLIEKENFLFTKKLHRKIKQSRSLMMELKGIPDPQKVLDLIMLEKGEFFDFFNQAQIDSIYTWADENFQMNETMFKMSFTKMKPFAVMQLATEVYFQGKTESYEITFEKIAKENQISTIGLETIEEQMSLFDNLSDIQQSEMLMAAIRNQEEDIEDAKKMQKLYTNQNLNALYKMITSSGGIISEEQNKFLDNRNKNWIPKIIHEISKHKTFIAVGAGHLDGQQGVIQLLINKGYTLTPIQL